MGDKAFVHKAKPSHASFQKAPWQCGVPVSVHPGAAFCSLTDTDWEDIGGKQILPISTGLHCLSGLSLLNTHQISTASSGGRKTQENTEAAASLVAVTAHMKAHPRRKIRVQGKHFRGAAKTVAPLFLPEVTACCRKPKIHRDPTLARAVWSGWTTTYFCTVSVRAPALWAHLGPSRGTGIVSPCTPPPCVLALAIWRGCGKQDLTPGWTDHWGDAVAVFLPAPAKKLKCKGAGGADRLGNAQFVTE